MKSIALLTLLVLLANACTTTQLQLNDKDLEPALLYAEEDDWDKVQDVIGDYATEDFSISTQPFFTYLMAQSYDNLNKKQMALFLNSCTNSLIRIKVFYFVQQIRYTSLMKSMLMK